ncbi:MAG: hypothetical protein ABSG95_02645 [Solirubrobacteraceae bacterium]
MSASRETKTALVIVGGMIVAGGLDMFERFDRPVRCRDGHLFTTIWIPLASLKAIRLGGRRFQHCPVGHHWTTVVPLDQTLATPADLETAAALHDIRIA